MKKKIVLISFYDKVSLSIRLLASIMKMKGHAVTLFYFKDDRTVILDRLNNNAKCYQGFNIGKYIGCGVDVNPPTEKEFSILTNEIVKLKPDIIGISTRTVTKELSNKIASNLKKLVPDATLVAGGYGPTFEPMDFLDAFDFVCLGEGESFASQLDEDLKNIPNIAWKEGSLFKFNELAKHSSLDQLPYSDWSPNDKFLIEDDRVISLAKTLDRKTYDILASRGCPSSCTYCMANKWSSIHAKYNCTNYPKVRLRSPDSVIEELLFAKKKYDISYVRFIDSIFGINDKWLLEFLDAYDKKIGIEFFCNLDIRFTSNKALKRLSQSYLKKSVVGIQSVDEENRRIILGRTISNERIIEYAHTLESMGILFKYDILHWNPFDTEETLSGGVDFLNKLPKNKDLALYELKFFPGSELQRLFVEKKPQYLPNNIYEFWAYIYLMILKSDEFKPIIEFAQRYTSFKEKPEIFQLLYEEICDRSKSKKIITARDTIVEGDIITTIKLRSKTGMDLKGINYDDRHKLINNTAKRTIEKGEIIRWEDLYGSYGYKD